MPANLNWDHWLGVAAERPFIGDGYYHPGNWRKRLDFGTGTFGDMGCHILDPVFTALALTAPISVRAEAGAPNAHNWGLDCQVRYIFPGTKVTTDRLTLTLVRRHRPPADGRSKPDRQSQAARPGLDLHRHRRRPLFAATSPRRSSCPRRNSAITRCRKPGGENHYLQFVEAVRGNGRTSAPFDYAGPLTESVLLGCLATRFTKTTLEWDAAKMQVTNNKDANEHVRRRYRKRWEVDGL